MDMALANMSSTYQLMKLEQKQVQDIPKGGML